MLSMLKKTIAVVVALAGANAAHAEKYYIDQFDVTVDGSIAVSDAFDGGILPPSSSYFFTFGTFPTGSESGGKLELDPSTNGVIRNIAGNQFGLQEAVSSTFLYSSSAYSVAGLFDLTAVSASNYNGYGLFFAESGFNSDGSFFANDIVLGVDHRPGGSQQVTFHALDEFNGNDIFLQAQDISVGGHSSIALTLDHEVGSGTMNAYYQYYDGTTPFGSRMSFDTPYSLKTDMGFTGFLATSPVPEPDTYALMMSGLAVLGAVARRNRKAEA